MSGIKAKSSNARYLRYWRGLFYIAVQLGAVVGVYILSFLTRYDFEIVPVPARVILKTLPLLVLVRMGVMALFHLYRDLWDYVGTKELLRIIKATTAGSVLFGVLLGIIFGFHGYPRSVLFLDWVGNIMALGGIRIIVPILGGMLRSRRAKPGEVRRMLVIGAGSAGALVCREAWDKPDRRLLPVGFIDDDPWKRGASVHGAPILGNSGDIPRIARQYDIDVLVIAMPSVNRQRVREIVGLCKETGLPITILPGSSAPATGEVSIDSLRDVDVSDILGRDLVAMDRNVIGAFLHGKRVLITGAAGSIGSELARQASAYSPEHLKVVDWSENNLLFLEGELGRTYPHQSVSSEVRDIKDYAAMRKIMAEYRPNVVFHAAAYKHVAFMERSPAEAIQNNVLGLHSVGKACQENGVGQVIVISTDKAVEPVSVMGASKRLGEKLALCMNSYGDTRFSLVRFGNVFGSSGSVVPIFQEQIRQGGPVTVTDARAERYFMAIPEAVRLVLATGALGKGGETFVLDMGNPIKILDLAREMISLAGKRPDVDIKIVFTGLRPGEKLNEKLTEHGQSLAPTSCPGILIFREDPPELDFEAEIVALSSRLAQMDAGETRAALKQFVPEYIPAQANARQRP